MIFFDSLRFRPRFVCLIFSVIPLSVLIIAVPGAGAQGRANDAPFSSSIQNFLKRPMDPAAVGEGLTIVNDRAQSPQARRGVLDKLQASRRGMDSARLRALLAQSTALSKDPNEDPAVAAQAIGTMASVNRLLLEKGEITTASAQSEAPFLMETAKDPARGHELRGRAIRALGDLSIKQAAPLLRELLAAEANLNQPEIARQGCIALARLSPAEALAPIAGVMSRTSDPAIFGSAAFALGRLNSPEAVAAIIKLQDRFPDSESVNAALAQMGDTITATLRRPGDSNLMAAIRAARALPGPVRRAQAAPLLRGLLRNAPPKERAEALGELLALAGTLSFEEENRELHQLLRLIEDQPAFRDEAARIRQRLAAKPLTITGPIIPVPAD